MTEDRKVKILCVEDEQEIRENIAEILRDEGFEVFEAENGRRGFESFVQNKPDLIVSDIMMPEVDGYGLLQLVRENKNVRNNAVPFIFLTALGQKDNVIKGVNLSANDYLIKPIDFDLMIAKVKEKTANASKVQESHRRDITNLKSQVSVILPSQLYAYLDIITGASDALRHEPYGPLPHRRYLEDIEKIYINATRLRAAITNSLDETVIENRLNAEEDIFLITEFLQEFISGLSDKFKSRIDLEPPIDYSMSKIKADRTVLLEALRKIFAGIFRTDPEGLVVVSTIIDHLDQMVIIFCLKSKIEKIDLRLNIIESEISKILDKQACRFEVVDGKENTAILTIPSYRVIS